MTNLILENNELQRNNAHTCLPTIVLKTINNEYKLYYIHILIILYCIILLYNIYYIAFCYMSVSILDNYN